MVTHRIYRLDIRLTEQGRQESADWEETEEKPHGFPGDEVEAIDWWRVPLGSREFVRVDTVGVAQKFEGKQTVEVKFVWRWRTNKIGESFDTGSAAFGALPPHVRDLISRNSWDSSKDYYGIATLERAGGQWSVSKIKYTAGEEGATAPGD